MGEPLFIDHEPEITFIRRDNCDLVRITGPAAGGGTYKHYVPRLVHYAHVKKWVKQHEDFIAMQTVDPSKVVSLKRRGRKH